MTQIAEPAQHGRLEFEPPTFGLFIDGEWVPSVSERTFESRNPADTRDVIGQFQAGTAADVARAVRAAEDAQRRWKRTPTPKRGEILYRFAELMAQNKERLARAMHDFESASYTSMPARSAPRLTCRSGVPRRPATATAKPATPRWTRTPNGSRSTSTFRVGCSVRRSTTKRPAEAFGMVRHSAGILLFRWRDGRLQVLLGHPGGPYWAAKDQGAWGIPKGEFDGEEQDAFAVARREFHEETGHQAPGDASAAIPLGDIRKKSGKIVTAWALEGDLDPANAVSNTFPLEWPPRSGQFIEVPEFDRLSWFDVDEAEGKMRGAESPLLERLMAALPASGAPTAES